jgi:hypothetical protein
MALELNFVVWLIAYCGVESKLGPLTGLLYLPRVIVRMENLVEWMAGETEVLWENLPQRHFVHVVWLTFMCIFEWSGIYEQNFMLWANYKD